MLEFIIWGLMGLCLSIAFGAIFFKQDYLVLVAFFILFIASILTSFIPNPPDTTTVHTESAIVQSISADTFIADDIKYAYRNSHELKLNQVVVIKWSKDENGENVVIELIDTEYEADNLVGGEK